MSDIPDRIMCRDYIGEAMTPVMPADRWVLQEERLRPICHIHRRAGEKVFSFKEGCRLYIMERVHVS